MAQANSLAAVDQLNIIFFGEMDITSAEKRLRVVMAAALQRILLRYYDTIQRSLAYSPFRLDSAALYAAAAAEFARSYIELFNRYYPQYLEALGAKGAGNALAWVRNHAAELSVQILDTSVGGCDIPLYDRMLNTARTEVNAMCNMAQMDAARSRGFSRKRWKTFGDNKVRRTHREASGQTVPIDQPFVVGGYQMMFPCDVSLGASVSEIANCRCTVQYL